MKLVFLYIKEKKIRIKKERRYNQVFQGTVSRYAPSSAEGIFDALYEVRIKDINIQF